MGQDAWQARWSTDLERSWDRRHREAGGHGPRVSIRPDAAAEGQTEEQIGEFDTRPLAVDEHPAVRTQAPSTAGRRRIVTLDSSENVESPRGQHQEIEIVGLIAEGGMGSVYRARQVALDRAVAVKRLHTDCEMPDAEALFESEACITAILDHPNVVPVYDLGVDDKDRLFYSMKHISGTPWDELLAERDPRTAKATRGGKHDLRGHLEILLEVSNAVAFAHSRGIIHRDIKPQNVIVGAFGEVLLVDWGLGVAVRPLAKWGRILDLQQVLIACGTPAYMPPEIALGLRDHVGTWTDVYMLGASLYEVLYGTVPHDESSAVDAVKVASDNQWAYPTDIAPEVRPFHEVFEHVLARSLATSPSDRYPDAQAFADAIRGGLRNMDSASLAADAIRIFAQAQQQEAAAQQARAAGRDAGEFGSVENRYRMLARAIAGLEQALSSWRDNREARHYLVEAHLLFAHVSIVAGDLTQAESLLQAGASLPHGAQPDAEQSDRLGKLRRRLQEKIAADAMRRKRARIWKASAALLAVTVVVGTIVAAVLIGAARARVVTERNHLVRLLIASATDGVQTELHRLFDPVRGAIRTSRSWAVSGRLDTDDPLVLSAHFIPLIEGYPVISSIMRADDQGHEYLLVRSEDGWLARTTAPGEPSQLLSLTRSGAVAKRREETLAYDPLTRPWYLGAVALRESLTEDAAASAIHWTEPYTFFTRQEPGITAAAPVTSAAGRRFVIGVDVPLSDLTTHTMQMSDSDLGKVFVLAQDDRLVALPRSPEFDDEEARRAGALQHVDTLSDAVPGAAVDAWRAAGREDDRHLRLESDGQPWWAGFRRFELGHDRVLWIAVVLPESDFAIPQTQ